jgi:uncharacterized DUF497 family protein
MRSRFTWDDAKAVANQQKHGLSFAAAQTLFDNPLAVLFNDDAHSEHESREIIIGHSVRNRLLLVCFTERPDSVRIISARRATTQERLDYEEGTRF